MRNWTLVACFGLFFLFGGCTVDQETASRVLSDEGYTDVELLGWSPLSCSDSEKRSEGFRATRSGHTVEGVVCCTGYIFGDCTVRH